MPEQNLLQINDLRISAGTKTLVQSLNAKVYAGKTLGIVGESGSGKSLSSLAIMGLLGENLKVEGSILWKGEALLKRSEKQFQALRGKQISMIFQEPMTALNPSMKCGLQVMEVLMNHTSISKKQAQEKVVELFKKVKLPRPSEIVESYPHQISGGQKQRVMIAMAIACEPELLIADEPTTALDVTVQADILKLLKELQDENGMGMIFITHDLAVIKEVADDILVLYKGVVKEYKAAGELFQNPENEYTKGLLSCRPTAETRFKRLPLVSDFLDGKDWDKTTVSSSEKRESALEKQKTKALFEIKDLRKWFGGKTSMFAKDASYVKAVDEVSFSIYPGESLGLVGESGCGKTTLGRILAGLEKANKGELFFEGEDISRKSSSAWRSLHKEIQIIFQDPFSSLNPRITIGSAIAEVLKLHRSNRDKSIKSEVEELLVKVGLEEQHYDRYPHEFSGGQRQRIGIARALAVEPKFIVCDESVSALDVSVQAQIINLLNDLKEDYNFTYLFISHDLSVVKYFSDRIVVMQKGKLIESGLADEVYNKPQEDYTKKLIASIIE